MDYQSTTSIVTTSHSLLAPAYLWIGAQEQLIIKTKNFLRAIFCATGGCLHCIPCRQIENAQHHAIVWLAPEKEQYTLEQIELIHTTIAYKLAPEEHFFFILTKADNLSALCANNLLKSIEEPPAGYHFILLAEQADILLPTIRSRCQTEIMHGSSTNSKHLLLDFFYSPTTSSPLTFFKELESNKIGERESMQLLDTLLSHWITKAKEAITTNNGNAYKHAYTFIDILKKAYLKPPMPGSSKLFWRNLFMQFQSIA